MFPKIGAKPPKWMVKIMENPYFLMDDLWVPLLLVQHPYIFILPEGTWQPQSMTGCRDGFARLESRRVRQPITKIESINTFQVYIYIYIYKKHMVYIYISIYMVYIIYVPVRLRVTSEV